MPESVPEPTPERRRELLRELTQQAIEAGTYAEPAPERTCRRFQLVRREDETGTSGTGVVAYGAEFPDGTAVLRWDTKVNSTVFYNSIEDLKTIHGHGGKTALMWLDVPPPADYGSVWVELRGYVGYAATDGGLINADDLLAYMDELKRKAMTPVRDWMNDVMKGGSDG